MQYKVFGLEEIFKINFYKKKGKHVLLALLILAFQFSQVNVSVQVLDVLLALISTKVWIAMEMGYWIMHVAIQSTTIVGQYSPRKDVQAVGVLALDQFQSVGKQEVCTTYCQNSTIVGSQVSFVTVGFHDKVTGF